MRIPQRTAHNRAVSYLSATVDCFSSRLHDVKKFGWRSHGSASNFHGYIGNVIADQEPFLDSCCSLGQKCKMSGMQQFLEVGGGGENNVCWLLFPVEFPH